MILESIVTTVDDLGRVNLAPMGPRTDDPIGDRFTLRPFQSTRTYDNLVATRRAVIHVTDDALLFARAAVGDVPCDDLVEPVEDGRWWRLRDCHRWFAVSVESVGEGDPRVDMECRVRHSGTVRPFFGFNRAKHAVLETAILATRTHLLEAARIAEEVQRLRPLVDKTGGPDEHQAFDHLCRTIRTRTGS